MNKEPVDRKPAFNYAIWLYEMNEDEWFDEDRHLIMDSSLGLIEKNDQRQNSHPRDQESTH